MLNAGLMQPPRHNVRFRWQYGEQATRCELTVETVHDVGEMLRRMNFASVDYRYRRAGEWDACEYPAPYRWAEMRARVDLVTALKAVHCYAYQSCEHPSWEGSSAQAFCRALEHHLVTMLPGYDAAPWAIADVSEAAA